MHPTIILNSLVQITHRPHFVDTIFHFHVVEVLGEALVKNVLGLAVFLDELQVSGNAPHEVAIGEAALQLLLFDQPLQEGQLVNLDL